MMTDQELFAACKRELFTAVVGDVLDTMGLVNQFLPQRIKPLCKDMVCIGRAMTVQGANATGPLDRPFGKMLEALDSLREDQVYLCASSPSNFAQWGGLMSNRAIRLKAAGAVMDGYSRDTLEILSLSFPVFSGGLYAKDQGVRGQIIDYNCPITFENGVVAHPGDIVFGDLDGVLIVPQHAQEEAFSKALHKCREENKVRKAILQGMGAREAFDKFGVM